MKKLVSTLLILGLLLSFSTVSYAIVAPTAEAGVVDARQDRMQERMQKIKNKLEKKLFKKQQKAAPPQLWEDSRFRLGIFAFAISLGLALISALGVLSGFFGFLAALAAITGLVLVIWALVDYSY